MNIDDIMNKKDAEGNFILSPLPYTDDYLEPFISARTVRYHYYKHLQKYIDNVNALKGDSGATIQSMLETLPRENSALFNNVSQVYNHYLYFEQLNYECRHTPSPKVLQLLNSTTWDALRKNMTDEAMRMFGSGWVFLTHIRDDVFNIYSYSNAGVPPTGNVIIALDVWEHAYYLDYQNDRKTYIDNFFHTLDWNVIEKRLKIIG